MTLRDSLPKLAKTNDLYCNCNKFDKSGESRRNVFKQIEIRERERERERERKRERERE